MKSRRSSIISILVTAAILTVALTGLLLFANSRIRENAAESRSSAVSSESSSEESFEKTDKAAADKTPAVKKVQPSVPTPSEDPSEGIESPSAGEASVLNSEVSEPEETPAETPEAAPADPPAETPAPEPAVVTDPAGRIIPAEGEYLSDLETVLASTYVDESQLDWDHLEKYFRSFAISDPLFERIYGNDRSYKTYCTVPREDLRYIKLLYRDFDGQTRIGELMVNYLVEDDILYIFEELYKASYPFNLIVLVDDFGADDDLSIAHNNTSAFNYRNITGGSTPSNHAYGTAIDINPYNNPYIIYDADGYPSILDEGAEAYLDRYAEDAYERHMINYSDPCYQLFTERGWQWGGDWSNPVDYQHFEKPIYP